MEIQKRIKHLSGLVAVFIALLLFKNFGSFEDASWTKLWILLVMILLASVGLSLIFNKKQYGLNIARIFSGILFVFSGFVKAVDPLGSKYKFIDYFEAWGMDFFNPTALTFGVILGAVELVVGLALLFKVFPKLNTWLALLFMVGFTPITLYLALQENLTGQELVHDCGCFGDALILTNWQTFVKNIFILIPVLISFFFRNKMEDVLTKNKAIKVMAVFVLASVGLSLYALQHLPPIDFRPFKVGTKIVCLDCLGIEDEPEVQVFQYAKFKNLQTGEIQEFDIINNYPDYNVWEYIVEQEIRVVEVPIEKEEVKAEDEITLLDSISQKNPIHKVSKFYWQLGETDHTCNILLDTSYVFLLVAYDINIASIDEVDDIKKTQEFAQSKGYEFFLTSASLEEDLQKFFDKTKLQIPVLSADDIEQKMHVRATPGLILLKDGVIINKWHHNDIPTVEEFGEICK